MTSTRPFLCLSFVTESVWNFPLKASDVYLKVGTRGKSGLFYRNICYVKFSWCPKYAIFTEEADKNHILGHFLHPYVKLCEKYHVRPNYQASKNTRRRNWKVNQKQHAFHYSLYFPKDNHKLSTCESSADAELVRMISAQSPPKRITLKWKEDFPLLRFLVTSTLKAIFRSFFLHGD